MQPKKIVVRSDQRMLFRFPFWIAFTASAIMSDDISRIKVEKDVSSMLNTCLGARVPGGGCSRYIRCVEMRQPKNMQSDARNAHMRIFLFGIPVEVVGSKWWSMVAAGASLLMEIGVVCVPAAQCPAAYPPRASSPFTLPSSLRWMW